MYKIALNVFLNWKFFIIHCPFGWHHLQHLGCKAKEDKKGSLFAKTLVITSQNGLQHKEEGDGKDICQVKVITAGLQADSAHKEGVASVMVSSTLCCITLPHYSVNWPLSSLGWPLHVLFSSFFYVSLMPYSRSKSEEMKIFAPWKLLQLVSRRNGLPRRAWMSSQLITMWNGLPRRVWPPVTWWDVLCYVTLHCHGVDLYLTYVFSMTTQ